MGRMSVKGFATPVVVFEVLSESDVETRFAATRMATIARMVGRSLERDLILERWSMAQRGEAQTVVITASPASASPVSCAASSTRSRPPATAA